MSHPSGHDPEGDAAVARVNAIRAARGLPPIVERHPDMVRRELAADRAAVMIAVAVLRREGCGAAVPSFALPALKPMPAMTDAAVQQVVEQP